MKITAAIWALLPAATQAAFKANADSTEYDNGEEAVEGLKSALTKEKEEKAAFGAKLATFEAEKQKEIEAAKKKALDEARSSGDFKAVEDDYKRQLAELRKSVDDQQKAREGDLIAAAIEKEAGELSKLFVTPGLATLAIKSRLKGEIVDGVAIVRVLDKTGKPSAAGITDLKNEYLTDKDLSASLVSSKGGGGGSTQTPGGGGSTPVSLKSFKTATEESIFAKENPEAYAALPASH